MPRSSSMASMVAVLLLMLLMLLLMLLLLPAAAAAVGAANAEAPSRAANGQDVPRAFFCAFFCLFWSSVDTPGVFNAKSAWCCACDCAPVVRVHLASGAAKEPATAPCVRGCLEVEEAGPVTPLSLFRRCLDAPNNPPNQDCLRTLSVRTMVANAFGRGRGGVYRLYRRIIVHVVSFRQVLTRTGQLVARVRVCSLSLSVSANCTHVAGLPAFFFTYVASEQRAVQENARKNV